MSSRPSLRALPLLFLSSCVIEALSATMENGGYGVDMIARTVVHTTCLYAPLPMAMVLLARSRQRRHVLAEAALVAGAAFACAAAGQFGWGVIAGKLRWYFYGDRELYLFDTYVMTAVRLTFRRFEDPLLIAFAPLMLFRFDVLRSRGRDTELQAARVEARLSEARLQLLRSQLNPHFVFNALNSIATLVSHDPAQAKAMLAGLSRFYSFAAESEGKQFVTVAEELSFVTQYLDIERMRFGSRLAVTLAIGDGCQELATPALLLQPLVENAVKHGISRQRGPGWIHIEVTSSGGRLHLTVDNGAVAGAQGAGGEGVGLANTRRRLAELFGEESLLSLERLHDRTRASIVIPARPLGTVAA